MKRILTLIGLLSIFLFGYSANGTWINNNKAGYKEIVQLTIKNGVVTPLVNIGHNRFAKLKTKRATPANSGLFEAWGFKNRNLALFLRPINANRLKVVAKNINTQNRTIRTKILYFTKKRAPHKSFNRQFIGNYHSKDLFSAISTVKIFQRGGQLYVKAWRNTPRGQRVLGTSRARLKNGKLHMRWQRGNIIVHAKIWGYRKNSRNTYRKIQLFIKAKNLRFGQSKKQIINLRRDNRSSYKREYLLPKPIDTSYGNSRREEGTIPFRKLKRFVDHFMGY